MHDAMLAPAESGDASGAHRMAERASRTARSGSAGRRPQPRGHNAPRAVCSDTAAARRSNAAAGRSNTARSHAEGEDGWEVGREREPELGLGAGELRVGEAWEDGDPGRAEVGEHPCRHAWKEGNP